MSKVKTQIFVFGSNTEGIHGAGAAAHAVKEYGAIFGQAEGLQGHAYGIVTKDLDKGTRSVPLYYIAEQAQRFIKFANEHPEYEFILTSVGTGLAGFRHDEIAPMFFECREMDNVLWPPEWANNFNYPSLIVPAPYYDEALNFCNERLKERGKKTISELPPGEPREPRSCPCSKACGVAVGTNGKWGEIDSDDMVSYTGIDGPQHFVHYFDFHSNSKIMGVVLPIRGNPDIKE